MRLWGTIVSMLVKSITVVAVCFAGTILSIHLFQSFFWGEAKAPIHLVNATYGGNCPDFATLTQHPNLSKPGNATAAVSAACEGSKSLCLFKIDATTLGDPAVGCGKEFAVTWRCGSDKKIHEAYFPAEADHRIALINCKAW